MITKIVLAALLAATALHAQTKPRVGAEPIPRHTAEPIIIRDGSLKIDIYSMSNAAVTTQNSDTIIVGGSPINQATFLVPVRVIAEKPEPGREVTGKLQTAQELAHPQKTVRQYVIEVQKFDNGVFSPYTDLVFNFIEPSWHIAPNKPNLLKVHCSAPVKLSGAWINHYQSTCEYSAEGLRLRLNGVTVVPPDPPDFPLLKINLGTGCSEFRIEPGVIHPPHDQPMTFDHPACAGLQFDPRLSYPTVRVQGLKSVLAIDVSLEKLKTSSH